jgi:hypothetical protein
MTWPKKHSADQQPASVVELTMRLVPLLIEGTHPALAALREQFPRARISHIELTGSGFHVDFEVPEDVPLTEPADFTGGDAVIRLIGSDIPGGCVLFVRGGRLATFEGYSYGDEWPENAQVASVDDALPIHPGWRRLATSVAPGVWKRDQTPVQQSSRCGAGRPLTLQLFHGQLLNPRRSGGGA